MFEDLFKELLIAKQSWQNEEEVRIGWIMALSHNLRISMQAERRRNDSSFNNVVIEFKSPGLFRARSNSPAFIEAMNERLLPYILRKSEAEDVPTEDYIGIAIDGEHICFAQVIDSNITYGELLSFSLASVQMVATALKDSFRRAITVDNLVDDFGTDSRIGLHLMQSLSDALGGYLQQNGNNKVKMLFEEWRTLFAQVASLTQAQNTTVTRNLRFTLSADTPAELITPMKLFVVHTYNSLIIKLLAAEIVSAHGLSRYTYFSQTVATYEDDLLIQTLDEQIEHGRLFDSAGIKGFIEEAIFSWYIDMCNDPAYRQPILHLVKEVLIQFSFYRTDSLINARMRDVLKGFYQALVPDILRKSLGEFYTPDWLVEFTINKLEDPQWLSDRALDPTCGSGSFLIGVIRRIRQQAEIERMDPTEVVQIITSNVWGFDLNPLAVQTARVNYLIAIADLLRESPGQEIEIPVLLADAIYSPSPQIIGDSNMVTYTIGSEIANLNIIIPSEIVYNRNRLDRMFEIMSEQVSNNDTYYSTKMRMIRSGIISEDEASSWELSLSETYNKVLELHQRNWNGIWFRIVRNFFWSASAGDFQIIVGNPPWVRWSNLPAIYRERIKPTCREYAIFSNTPHHGGNELDVSGMITYTVADKWLALEGQLTFVLTQSHFQIPSSQGFRSFNINNQDRLIPISVDDFKSLKPFQAANKTAVVLFKKKRNIAPEYPVPYVIWEKAEDQTSVIPNRLTLEEVMSRVRFNQMEATPVNGSLSPWAILPVGRFEQIDRITGTSTWVQGRKGITTDLNGVYFVRIIRRNERIRRVEVETRPNAGKINIGPAMKFWIEPDMLYPLVKGAGDFSECWFEPEENLYAIVPNRGVTNIDFEEAVQLLDTTCRLTNHYFQNFREVLSQRSTLRRYLRGKPYYSIYNIGQYAFAPYKVIWAEQASRFKAAVITDYEVPLLGMRPYIPDHKIFYVPFSSPEPAYYLCGLLNSNIVREYVESHNVSINVGNIFKHMNLPSFNSDDERHRALARLVMLAHDEHNEDLLVEIREMGDAILSRSIYPLHQEKVLIAAEELVPYVTGDKARK